MADTTTGEEIEFDDDGKPITPAAANPETPAEGASPAPKTEDDEDDEDDANVDVPVRKSTAQHIIARKNRTIEKLRSKAADDVEDDSEAPDDEDDNLTPEASGALTKAVKRQLDPILKTLASKADEEELGELLSAEPEAKKYEKRIRAFMAHPNYQGVPPSFIFQSLAYKNAQAVGAKKKNAADTEAGQMRGGGSARRSTGTTTGGVPTAEEISEMSDAEFEELEHKARTGAFVTKSE